MVIHKMWIKICFFNPSLWGTKLKLQWLTVVGSSSLLWCKTSRGFNAVQKWHSKNNFQKLCPNSSQSSVHYILNIALPTLGGCTHSRDEPSWLVAYSIWNMNWQHTAPDHTFSVERESEWVTQCVSEWARVLAFPPVCSCCPAQIFCMLPKLRE